MDKERRMSSMMVEWKELFWMRILLIACFIVAAADGDEFCFELNRAYIQKKDNKEFYLFKSKAAFFEASNYCMQLGLRLATITDEEQLRKAENFLRSKGVTKDGVWIGGTNIGNSDNSYYWFSIGEAIKFTNWDTNQPDSRKWPRVTPLDDPEVEHCVFMRNFVDGKFKWADGLCSEPLYFLCDDSCDRVSNCMLDQVCGNDPREPSQKYITRQAPECRNANWTYNKSLDPGSCNCLGTLSRTIQPKEKSYIRFPPLKLNWWEARNWCLKAHLTMAVIFSEEDQNRIQKAIKTTRDQIWVSGTDWGQHGFWYWESTGHILTKFDGVDEPFKRFWKTRDGAEVKEHCLYIDARDKYNWRDGDCFSKKYFVCESLCGDIHKCYCTDHSKIPDFG